MLSASVARDSVLPGLKEPVIILLLGANASLVLNLGELGGALFVHAVLKVATHGPVALSYLAKHISLMSLAIEGLFERTLFVHAVQAVDLGVNHLLVIVLKPFGLLLQGLL